jgi:hypothetical protein
MKALTNDYIGLLISKYLCDNLDKSEQQDLQYWLGMHAANREKFAELTDLNQLVKKMRDWSAVNTGEEKMLWQSIKAELKPLPKPKGLVPQLEWLKVAAAVVIVVLVVMYAVSSSRQQQKEIATAPCCREKQ